MSDKNTDGAAMAADSDQWNPILRRVHTANPREFHLLGADGQRRRFRLAAFEHPGGDMVGNSLLGEDLIIQTDNMVPEEAIVYADKGTDDMPRLGIAHHVPEPPNRRAPKPPFSGGWEPKDAADFQ